MTEPRRPFRFEVTIGGDTVDDLRANLVAVGRLMAAEGGVRTTQAAPVHTTERPMPLDDPPPRGPVPACPLHLAEMVRRPGGSKTKPDGQVVSWPPFYSCPRRDCRETAEIEGG